MSASNLLLVDALKKLSMECEDIQAKYNELLFSVGNKFPNETRHETALRYIREAENRFVGSGMNSARRQEDEAILWWI